VRADKELEEEEKAELIWYSMRQGTENLEQVSEEATPLRQQAPQGISVRAIVIGALLIPLNAYWIVRLEHVMFGPYCSSLSLFANVVFALFLLIGLNALLRRWLPRFVFSQSELLAIYTMLAICTGLAGQDGVGLINQVISHGAWFTTSSNGWDRFSAAFPDWLVIRDREALHGHFLGHSSFYQPAILRAWLPPLLAWTVFVLLLCFVSYSLIALLRRQWADRERMTFPITWLPVQMTVGGTGADFFRSRRMWRGFTVAAMLSLWNGLAFLYPSLPALPLGITDLTPLISANPWNAIGWLPVTLYPVVIGLGYLLPLDLLFSCWFFFLFWKMQVVLSRAMAWDARPGVPYILEQGFGAVYGLFAFTLWTGRYHWLAVWNRAVRSPRDTPQTGDGRDLEKSGFAEGLSERAALIWLGGGTLGLLVFCLMAHITWWVAAAFFALYLPFLVVVTRIRAELGSPVHDFHFSGTNNMLPRALGTAAMRPQDLGYFSLTYALDRSHRGDVMPIGMEGMQMARQSRMDAQRMFGAILLATALGVLCTFWAFEHQAYTLGASEQFHQGVYVAQESFDRLAAWTSGSLDAKPNPMAAGAMGVGFLFTVALLLLRLRFFGFPLHPIGYAVSSAWGMNLVWFPLLIAWLLKGLTLRYGGLRVYLQMLPFFLGLVLGDCVMGGVWGILSLILNIRTYNFFGV
jgi:hypothetical protein